MVFVRYGSNHLFEDEWVYNAANIDASSIVWRRATNPEDEAEAVRYYPGRKFRLAEVEKDTVHLSAYPVGDDSLVLRR